MKARHIVPYAIIAMLLSAAGAVGCAAAPAKPDERAAFKVPPDEPQPKDPVWDVAALKDGGASWKMGPERCALGIAKFDNFDRPQEAEEGADFLAQSSLIAALKLSDMDALMEMSYRVSHWRRYKSGLFYAVACVRPKPAETVAGR